ncbi:MmcQ/YjbR family DNA-binding protein [Neobacillus mesonae]|nr:MmcQ/YjbR family DNA-binding protein [Neobacillus mesonae]
MNPIVSYCLSKKAAKEDYPFGADTLVVKIEGKMFALIPINKDNTASSISLKCDPIIAENLRQQHSAVVPGYHLNKKHWNTVYLDQDLSVKDILPMIDHSYELVFKNLTKKQRDSIESRLVN